MRLLILSLFLFVSNFVFAQDYKMQYRDLQNMINSQDIKTIDQLLKALPQEVLTNPILVYDSHALRLNLVTPETPRIILANFDSTLIMALTRYPGEAEIAAGRDTLEIISFNAVTGLFEMRDLVFNGVENPFVQGQPVVNPTICLGCHGMNPRPILQSYNAWPGFYGSFSNVGISAVGSEEFKKFSLFLDNKSKHPRYRDLTVQANKTASGIEYSGGSYQGQRDNNLFTFGRNLEDIMFTRLAMKIAKHPESENILLFLHALDNCKPGTGCNPDSRMNEVYQAIENSDQKRKESLELIFSKVVAQAKNGFEFKLQEFLKFNFEYKKYDSRGVFDYVYSSIDPNSQDLYNFPDSPRDKLFFKQQIKLIEVLFKKWGFDDSDISTFPQIPSLGLFHLVRGEVGLDKYYFSTLYDRCLDFKKLSPAQLENFDEKVKVYLQSLEIPDASKNRGVFY